MKNFILILLVCLASFCNCLPRLQNNPQLKDSISNFNTKLYQQITKGEQGNVFYSPFCLHLLFTEMFLGAPRNTSTSQELSILLDIDNDHLPDYAKSYRNIIDHFHSLTGSQKNSLNIANKIYTAKDITLKEGFQNVLTQYFKTALQKVNFSNSKETADVINAYVRNATRGLIPKVYKDDSFDGLTRIALLNAVYFKGAWQVKFDPNLSSTHTFKVQESVETNFTGMRMSNKFKLAHLPQLKARVLQIPYENDDLSMLIILPNVDSNIQEVELAMQNYSTSNLLDNMDSFSRVDVDLILPKFETSFEVDDLPKLFKSLGVRSIFDAYKSNLSYISDEPFYITDGIHKAIIKINEEGTESAAVAGINVGVRSGVVYKQVEEFTVDRPFLFQIVYHQESIPIFAGRVVDPNGQLKLRPSGGNLSSRTIEVNKEAGGEVSSPCDQFGFKTIKASSGGIRLPCKGGNTIHLQNFQDEQQLLRAARLAEYNYLRLIHA